MRQTTLLAVGILVLAAVSPAWAGGPGCRAQGLLDLGGESSLSVEALRAMGPQAVGRVFDEIERDPDLSADPERWKARLDAVCGMKDCADARLFWFTDLSAALQHAQATGRPVLSLRLLGRLDEELSCANSRLFRLALYTHPQISQALRDGWVLHWHTVREVPTVSIRFGPDRAGPERFLEGTVTGNSIHYVLDTQGRIVDALPGLYGPGAFLDALTIARIRAVQASTEPDAQFVVGQMRYHGDRAELTWQALQHDLRRLDVDKPAKVLKAMRRKVELGIVSDPARTYSARQAAPRAETKMAVEVEVLEAVALESVLPGGTRSALDWPAIGALHPEWNGPVPVNAAALARRIAPGANLEPALGTLSRLFLADTAQNEYALRPFLRRWLISAEPQRDLEAFDERVYADLFLTPLSDPWLGLSPENLYTALRPVGELELELKEIEAAIAELEAGR